jgi:serine/threonine protein kinase
MDVFTSLFVIQILLVLFKEYLYDSDFWQYYIAEKQSTHENVLIKIMISYYEKEQIRSLESELRILISLKHKNLMKIMEWFILDNYFYVVMEYCSGGNLEKILKKQKKIPQQVYYK